MQLDLPTTAALLAIAATLCAANPLPPWTQGSCLRGDDDVLPPPGEQERHRETTDSFPLPPHLTPRQIDEDTKMAPPSKANPELSHHDDDHFTCVYRVPSTSLKRIERSRKVRKALEEGLHGHGGVKANEESGHLRQPDMDASGPVDLKSGAQPSNPSGPPGASMKRRRTTELISVPKLTQEEIEHYAKYPLLMGVPQCKHPWGYSKEDQEKVMRAHKLLEEKARGHGHSGAKPSIRVLPPDWTNYM
jgi:hypothetical protein